MILFNYESNHSFSETELAVAWFFMTGMKSKQIAEWIGISEKSVGYYKRKMMKRIGVKNNNEFIIWLLDNKIRGDGM